MLRKTLAVLLPATILILSACAGVVSTPAPATVVPETAIPAAAAPTVAASPTAVAAAPSAAPTTAPATSDPPAATGAPTAAPAVAAPGAQPAAPGATGAIRLVLATDSQAQFKVREQLAGRNFPNDAIGTTKDIAGALVIGPDGAIVPDQSKFTVQVATLRTDESRRDNFIQRNTLETATYPTAEFVPTAVSGLPSPLPTAGAVSFKLTGNMTIHGTTHPTTWDVTATIAGKELTGKATTNVKFEDFGMTPPRAMVVLSVDDNIGLEVDFHLVQQ